MSLLTMLSALWFGIFTSISPCPLATNIAAIGFVARHTGRLHSSLLAGFLYTIGRTIAYLALGVLVMSGLFASSQISLFLQLYIMQALGPALILVGMLLLGLLRSSASMNLVGDKVQHRAEKGGILWSLSLGILFALSFCPVSAGIFFGVLIPLSAANQSLFVLPLLYGVGTAVPVILFALLIAFASNKLGQAFDILSRIEIWIRRITGTVFILAGIYYCLTHIYT